MTTRVHRRGDPNQLTSEPDLARVYDEFQPFVRGALRKHYVDPADLEDMTQEVFLVLLRHVDEASRTRSFGAWLYQIARRVAANQRRTDRRRLRKHEALGAATDAAAYPALDPHERCVRAEAWAFVREFLESLDAEACAVFVMLEIEGLRGAEIAARLRLSLPMTYARIRTVREHFARRVARERRGVLAALWWACGGPAISLLTVAMATSRRLKLATLTLLLVFAGLFTLRGGGDFDEAPGGSSAERRERSDEGDMHVGRVAEEQPEVLRGAARHAGAFAGIVVDLRGAPIATAIVCGDSPNASDHLLTNPPSCVTTDERGRFRIEGTRLQAHTLEALAHGFVPSRFHGLPTQDIRIVLHPGGVELSGVVADVHGGPIEGAWVAIENRSEATLGATVTTDDTGAFSLWVAEGSISLAAGASGYATSFRMALAPARDLEIELGAESMIAGVVVDDRGHPVPDVLVSALLQEGTERYANRGGSVLSDDAGRWEIRGLAPNEYILDAAADRGWGRADGPLDLGIGDRREGIRIELMPGVEIVGRILDAETGAVCSDGYAVTLDASQSITREDFVDGDGLVTLRPLTGGAVYRVTVSCRGYAEREFEVDLRHGPVDPAQWALARGSDLVVSVIDSTGEALQDWTVELAAPLGSRPSNAPTSFGDFTTDAEGMVTFTGLRAGEYRVIARGPGHPPVAMEPVVVASARSTIELRTAPGVPVTGTAVDAAGHPLAGALVALQRLGPGMRLPQVYWSPQVKLEPVGDGGPYHAVSDAAGEFRIASVGRGEYGVWVLPEAGASAYQRPGEHPVGFAARIPGAPHRSIVVADEPIALALRLGSLTSISGVVRGEDDDVVMDARVFAVREHDGGALEPRGRPQLSDREGRYALDGLEAGTYTMLAYRPGGGVARRVGVAAGSRAVDLELPRVGRVAGVVRGSDGRVVKAFTLHVQGGGRHDRPPFPAASKDGRFVVSGLGPGPHSIWVVTPEGEGKVDLELDEGEQRSGIVITVAKRTAAVTGRLVRSDGAPATGWLAAWREPGADKLGHRWITKLDDDGRFVFRRLPPWTFAIVAFREVPELEEPNVAADLVSDAAELRVVEVKEGEAIDLGDLTVPEGDR